jgi:hypothetical protein
MKRLCNELGFIKDGKVVTDEVVEKLEYYRVSPYGIGSEWKQKAPYKYKEL